MSSVRLVSGALLHSEWLFRWSEQLLQVIRTVIRLSGRCIKQQPNCNSSWIAIEQTN